MYGGFSKKEWEKKTFVKKYKEISVGNFKEIFRGYPELTYKENNWKNECGLPDDFLENSTEAAEIIPKEFPYHLNIFQCFSKTDSSYTRNRLS